MRFCGGGIRRGREERRAGTDEGEGKMEDIFGEGGGDGEDDVMKED